MDIRPMDDQTPDILHILHTIAWNPAYSASREISPAMASSAATPAGSLFPVQSVTQASSAISRKLLFLFGVSVQPADLGKLQTPFFFLGLCFHVEDSRWVYQEQELSAVGWEQAAQLLGWVPYAHSSRTWQPPLGPVALCSLFLQFCSSW